VDPEGPSETRYDIDERWRQSKVAAGLRSLSKEYERAADTSGTTSALARIREMARNSRLYRWWATPPEHDVIRIDMTDSRLLGPVVRMTLAMISTIQGACRDSHSARAYHLLAHWTRGAPVRKVSLVALVLVAGSLAASLQRPTPIGWGQLALLAGLALFGLREGRSWEELGNSRVGRILRAPFDEEESQR
jgi:hypothetical protein